MTNKTFRIGNNDYELANYQSGNTVRLDKIPAFGEIRERGNEYESEILALSSVGLEALEGYKKYTLTIEEALEVAKKIFGLFHKISSRKSGYIVILSKKEPSTLSNYDECRYYYCRGIKAANEISLEAKLLPKIIETTNYDDSDMFYLNHGMSWERYMST
tara:strand:+ start:2051 stop:2530 length:480 start_codon:yes stop_codon:yes gene_type:complete